MSSNSKIDRARVRETWVLLLRLTTYKPSTPRSTMVTTAAIAPPMIAPIF